MVSANTIPHFLLYLQKVYPNLLEIEEKPTKTPSKKERVKQIVFLEKPKIKPLLFSKPLTSPKYEEPSAINSARCLKNAPNVAYDITKRRRSLSSHNKMKPPINKEFPCSARNHCENNKKFDDNLTLSEVSEGEEEEKYRRNFIDVGNYEVDNKIISIQNILLKEKNQEISLLKKKIESFQDICTFKLFF